MFKYILIVVLIIVLFYCYKNKIYIKFETFLQRGYKRLENEFGVMCFVGKQGQGKTQGAYSYLLKNKDKKIFANMKSLRGINYTYFNGLDELLKLSNESDCIIFYDELFNIIMKGTKLNTDVMNFLSQMRKRHIIFITTAQEWLEIPITLRRYCRFMVDCDIKSIFGYPIIIKRFGDAYNMVWDDLQNDYICPIIKTYIEHGRKKIVNGYDTFEQIPKESVSPIEIKKENSLIVSLDNLEEQSNNSTDTRIFSTTTNSNSCVSVSVDKHFTEDEVIENNQNLGQSFIDTEFWDSVTSDDFTDD